MSCIIRGINNRFTDSVFRQERGGPSTHDCGRNFTMFLPTYILHSTLQIESPHSSWQRLGSRERLHTYGSELRTSFALFCQTPRRAFHQPGLLHGQQALLFLADCSGSD